MLYLCAQKRRSRMTSTSSPNLPCSREVRKSALTLEADGLAHFLLRPPPVSRDFTKFAKSDRLPRPLAFPPVEESRSGHSIPAK